MRVLCSIELITVFLLFFSFFMSITVVLMQQVAASLLGDLKKEFGKLSAFQVSEYFRLCIFVGSADLFEFFFLLLLLM